MTEIKKIMSGIIDEVSLCLTNIDDDQIVNLETEIKKAGKIFVAGTGRSLMMIRAFAMRLMHMGYEVYVVGETVTPAISPEDLLVIASGSGKTRTLVTIAKECKRLNAALALITTDPDSAIADLADHIVQVKTTTPKSEHSDKKTTQMGGNTFEQCVLLLGDAIVIDLSKDHDMKKNNEVLMKRHANLE